MAITKVQNNTLDEGWLKEELDKRYDELFKQSQLLQAVGKQNLSMPVSVGTMTAASGSHTHTINPSIGTPVSGQSASAQIPLKQILCMRLNRTFYLNDARFQFMECVPLKDGRVIIFMVFDNKEAVLEDDSNLFPSDALVTKLRCIMG